jgi:branched-chain amino acid transport system permease protein
VLLNSAGVSGGPQGRTFPPVVIGPFDFSPGQTLQLGGLTIDHDGLYYYLALLILAAATAFAWSLRRTRGGRAMLAVRDRETPAALMGIDVGRAKVVAFVVSAALAGVSGALYASYLSFAQPTQWDLALSIQFIAAIIVGGMGSTAGPLLGSAVVFALPSLLKNLPFVPEEGSGGISVGNLSSICYGLLIVAFLVLEPRGLVGIADRLRSLRRRRVRPGRAEAHAQDSRISINNPEEVHP